MIQNQIQHTWSEHFIWLMVRQFGAIPILSCMVTGAVVLVILVFRKVIQEKFGDAIAWADEFINQKGRKRNETKRSSS